MIKCPVCQATHVDNTLFCSECGHYLVEDETQPTEIEIRLKDREKKERSKSSTWFQVGLRPVAIRLKIGPSKREVEMPLDRVVHLGRVAPASNIFPEIDLSGHGSLAKRISRRHARILKQGDRVVVEDLASANGTFVNGKRLDPYLPESLNDGDTLQLGRLSIEVKILTSSS